MFRDTDAWRGDFCDQSSDSKVKKIFERFCMQAAKGKEQPNKKITRTSEQAARENPSIERNLFAACIDFNDDCVNHVELAAVKGQKQNSEQARFAPKIITNFSMVRRTMGW